MDNIKYKTFEDVTEVYGKTNLCKICNIKQIITYAKLGVQPVWIDEGYGGKLIAYYFIPETKVAWKYWLENRPDTGQAKMQRTEAAIVPPDGSEFMNITTFLFLLTSFAV